MWKAFRRYCPQFVAVFLALAACRPHHEHPPLVDLHTLSVQRTEQGFRFAHLDNSGTAQTLEIIPPVEFRWTQSKADGGADRTEVVLSPEYWLAGQIADGPEGGVTLRGRIHGERWVRFERVLAILFPAWRDVIPERLPLKEHPHDLLILRTGNRIEGTVIEVSAAAVRFLEGRERKEVTLPIVQLAALWLVPVERPPQDRAPFTGVVETVDGSSIRGEVRSVKDDHVDFVDLYGLHYPMVLRDVRLLRFEGTPRARPLEPVSRPSNSPPLRRDVPTVKEGRFVLAHSREAEGAGAFRSDDKLFAVYGRQGGVEVLSTSGWEAVRSYSPYGSSESSRKRLVRPPPAFAPSGRELYAQLGPGSISVLNVETGAQLGLIVIEEDDRRLSSLRSVLPSAGGRLVVTGRDECFVYVPEKTRFYSLSGRTEGLVSLDGNRLIGFRSGKHGAESALVRYDTRTYKLRDVKSLDGELNVWAAPLDLASIFIAGNSGLRVHEPEKLEEVSRHPIPGGPPVLLAVSGDGLRVAVGTANHAVTVFQVSDMSTEATIQFSSAPSAIALSATGKFMAVHAESVTHVFERR